MTGEHIVKDTQPYHPSKERSQDVTATALSTWCLPPSTNELGKTQNLPDGQVQIQSKAKQSVQLTYCPIVLQAFSGRFTS